MKTTTLLKSLFVAIVLSITTLVYAQDEPTIPEVTTMEEVISALGENDQTVGVKVHFKNLEPIFVVKSLYTDIYMPDGTTLLKIKTACPKKFDAIGRYYYNNDKESGSLGFKFEVEEITAAYAFHNLYYLAESKTQTAVEIVNPVVVTAVDNNNVFVQYQDFDKGIHGNLIVVEGEHSLQIGDQLTGFTATLNLARRDSLFTETDTVVTMIRNTYFNVEASSFGTITSDNTIKYKTEEHLDSIKPNEAIAVQLPIGGIIKKENDKYFYKIGDSSVEITSTTVNLDNYLNNPISEMVRGVINYYHTAENTMPENRFNVIITEIKALDTNYATIAEWIDAAQSGITTGSLKNPVNVTLSVYQSYKSFVFIQDETGAICLNFGDYKENPIKTGDVIKGIEGNLISETNAIIAPIIEIAKENAPTYVKNIEVLESNVVVKPIDVTIAELNADEDAIKEGVISKFANHLVRLNGVKKAKNFYGKTYYLVQDNDTLPFNQSTLQKVWSKLDTLQMTITGVIDYKTINSSALYSIYPRSIEDVHLVAPEFVPAAGMYEKEVEVAITMFGEQGVDYTAVYYTTDPEFNPEDEPNMNDGEEYTEPLQLTETTTIHAMATYLEDESKSSPIVKAIYTIVDQLPDNTDNVELIATVYTNNGSIIVNTEVGNNIEVYTINGQNIYNAMATSNITTIDANGNNVAIVRVNGKSVKVAVR